jgi:hypothetical protein
VPTLVSLDRVFGVRHFVVPNSPTEDPVVTDESSAGDETVLTRFDDLVKIGMLDNQRREAGR